VDFFFVKNKRPCPSIRESGVVFTEKDTERLSTGIKDHELKNRQQIQDWGGQVRSTRINDIKRTKRSMKSQIGRMARLYQSFITWRKCLQLTRLLIKRRIFQSRLLAKYGKPSEGTKAQNLMCLSQRNGNNISSGNNFQELYRTDT